MSIRRIAKVAYHFAQRARGRQAVDGMGIEGSLAGKRVVISTDGGRLRVRKDKRGKKTKKGRSRYSTDWGSVGRCRLMMLATCIRSSSGHSKAKPPRPQASSAA